MYDLLPDSKRQLCFDSSRDHSNIMGGKIRTFRKSEMGEIEGGDRFCVSGQLPVWFTLKCRDEATEEERRERARWANLHLPLRNLNAPLKKIPLRRNREKRLLPPHESFKIMCSSSVL
ncbi:hypothetical protein Bca4012_028839 [Brassica carinata]